MNWYPRYAGDYMQDTAHLSLTEHGAYTMLLDHYYGSEKPLPADNVALFRICRAFTEHEREAVIAIADQYFPVNGDGKRHNKRADKELGKRQVISQKRKLAGAKGADSKWHGKTMANATTPTATSTATSRFAINDDSSEPDKPGTEPAVVTIPLIKKQGEYGVTQAQIDEWQDTYPAIDVLHTLKHIRQWNLANPSKRKTAKGIVRHIIGWLERDQNNGGAAPSKRRTATLTAEDIMAIPVKGDRR